MIPALGWIPVTVGTEFPVMVAEAPEPIVGVYRDYSAKDPLVPEVLDSARVAPGAHLAGATRGLDEDGVLAIKASLELHEVFGAVLLDRFYVSSYADIQEPVVEARPGTTYEAEARPVTTWEDPDA
jgi:hypothetical protein